MKNTTLLGSVAVLIAIAVAIFVLGKGGNGGAPVIGIPNNDVFHGRVLGQSLNGQSFTGAKALTDKGCTTDPRNGLSNCTSAILTSAGTVYFNYEHNMMMVPCLSNGDVVNMQVDANGGAVVTRTLWSGNGGA